MAMNLGRHLCPVVLATAGLLFAACTSVPPAVELTPLPDEGGPLDSPAVLEPAAAHAYSSAVAGRRLWLPLAEANLDLARVAAAPSPPAPTTEPTAAPTAPATPTAPPPPPIAVEGPGAACAGIAMRRGDELVVDGTPVFVFGINGHYLLDKEFPEEKVEPILQALSERGVNTLRVWFFSSHDPDRFERLLDLGRKHGIRYVVTLEDNVFKGVDWFFSDKDEKKYRPHLDRTVARFKDRPEILMWEVMNEPNCGDGRYDDGCLKTIRDWVTMASLRVKDIDPCHIVSSGMIGAGNMDSEQKSYRLIHRKDSVEILSVHKGSTDERPDEVALAKEEERPIFYGEIYDVAYDDGCAPLDGGSELDKRAERIKDDLQQAIADGADGYLLWDFAAGPVTRTQGGAHDYCSKFGYGLEDPVWKKLQRTGLPPAVPWR